MEWIGRQEEPNIKAEILGVFLYMWKRQNDREGRLDDITRQSRPLNAELRV